MPCLNEAETLATCIEKTKRAFRELGIQGETIVADNGSSDGSQDIALRLGARVVTSKPGATGNALHGGITAARGKYVIMADADDSYEFSADPSAPSSRSSAKDSTSSWAIDSGVTSCPEPCPGSTSTSATPCSRGSAGSSSSARPVTSTVAFAASAGRPTTASGFEPRAWNTPARWCVKATLLRLRIAEVPTILHKEGRSRPPHLRSWRDGWRHLRFMLMFSPRWLFLYPGLGLLITGLFATAALWAGPVSFGTVAFDIATLLVASLVSMLGMQLIVFAPIRRYS